MGSERTRGPWQTDGKCSMAEKSFTGPMVFIHAQGVMLDVCPAIAGGQDKATARANAEFIVRACNSHDALLEALKDLLRVSEMVTHRAGTKQTALDECPQCGCYHFAGYTGDCRNDDERFASYDPFEVVAGNARAVIALTEPKPRKETHR